MTKLQASMKESSTRRHSLALARIAYKVASCFKACHNCGEFTWIEVGGRDVKRYSSGYAVYRAYAPANVGFTYWCFECGAKDLRAWEDAKDIGKDAIRGTRDAIQKTKYGLRKEELRLAKAEVKDPTKAVTQSRTEKIAELQRQIEAIKGLLKK